MKLPISLLVLAALGQAATPQSTTAKTSVAPTTAKNSVAKTPLTKTSGTKPKDNNQTNKRELYEGNFGERNKEHLLKYEDTGSPAKIVHERELNELVSELPPSSLTQQIFGARLPPITKISDVLSEHGPSFEAAVAKHLYSPISVYQAKYSAPATSRNVPIPAASQPVFSMPQGISPNAKLPIPHIPDNTMNQLKIRFESYPKPLESGYTRQQISLPQEIFRQQKMPKKIKLFPIYDQFGPFRYQGEVVPSQYLHESGLYQIFPFQAGFNYGNQEGYRDNNNYPNHGSHEQFKAQPTEIPKMQIDVPVPNQGYHSHPNGGISFASFSHNVPFITQYNTALQSKGESFKHPQPGQLGQHIHPEVMQPGQEQKLAAVKPMVYRLIQELEQFEPVYQQQPQLTPFKQQIQSQPSLNALQQHLLFQVPQQFSNRHIIELPAFKPLPESLLSPDFLQQNRAPMLSQQAPRPFSYKDQSTQPPEHINVPVEQPVFLPTPLQLIPTSTPKAQPVSDQQISSTTIQPNVNNDEEPKEELIQKESQTQSQTSLPPAPGVIYQSQPAVLSTPIRSTTYLPFVTYDQHPNRYQYYTSLPEYASTKRPQSKETPRHDVVIQRQEIQELILEPPPRPTQLHYHQNHRQIIPQQEREVYQIRSQDNQQLYEQLQLPQFQHEIQDLNSEQYLVETRQSQQPSHPLQPQPYQSQSPQQGSKQDNKTTQNHEISESKNQISTPQPAQASEEQTEAVTIKEQLESQPQQQQQSATEKPEEERINLLPSTPNKEQSSLDSVVAPIQSDQPQIYGQSQYVAAHSEYSPLVGVPSYSDVQYFGKFAESLLGNRHF